MFDACGFKDQLDLGLTDRHFAEAAADGGEGDRGKMIDALKQEKH